MPGKSGKKVVRKVGSANRRAKKAAQIRMQPVATTVEARAVFKGRKASKVPLAGKYAQIGLASRPLQDPSVTARGEAAAAKAEKLELEIPDAQPRAPNVIRNSVSEASMLRVQRLVRRYGTDVDAMARDRKMNPYQLTAGELRRKIVSYLETEALVDPDCLALIKDFAAPAKRTF